MTERMISMNRPHHDVTSATEAASKSIEALQRALVASEAAKDIEASSAILIMKSVRAEAKEALVYALQAAEFAVKSAEETGDQQSLIDATATLTSIRAVSDIFKLIF